MNRLTKWIAAGMIACGLVWVLVAKAEAQWVVVQRPVVVAQPTTTFFAPAPVTTFHPVVAQPTLIAPAPVTTFYAPAPVTTTFFAPAPTTAFFAPAPVVVAPSRAVVYRPNPILRPFRWTAAPVW